MEQATTTIYYTCLNGHCPKHRNIFTDGDPQHVDCARKRLHFSEERRPVHWLWFAAPIALTLGALAAAYRRR